MNNYQKQRCIEIMLYIINKAGFIDIYHLLKILYFSQREYLTTYGTKMFADDIYALTYGPVPTRIFNVIKHEDKDEDFIRRFSESINYEKYDASNFLSAKRTPNMDYLSRADISILDKNIADNLNLTFNELLSKSHTPVWKDAYEKTGKDREMKPIDMARECGVSDEMLEYIADELETEKLLS